MKNGDGPDSPLLGDGTYCGRVPPDASLTTTANHLYVKAVGTGLHVVYKLTYKYEINNLYIFFFLIFDIVTIE